ncbi:hypothetical protein ACFLYK_01010 [Candidatus Cloacimonadota bacterium]
MGFQHDVRENVDPVMIETSKGIAFADVVIQLPFFILAAIGLWRLRYYGIVASWIGLGINLYWITIAWAKQYLYLNASFECEPFPLALHGILSFFFLFSFWGIWYLFKKRALFD